MYAGVVVSQCLACWSAAVGLAEDEFVAVPAVVLSGATAADVGAMAHQIAVFEQYRRHLLSVYSVHFLHPWLHQGRVWQALAKPVYCAHTE